MAAANGLVEQGLDLLFNNSTRPLRPQDPLGNDPVATQDSMSPLGLLRYSAYPQQPTVAVQAALQRLRSLIGGHPQPLP